MGFGELAAKLLTDFFLVFERGGVAVVPVGDVDRFVAEEVDDLRLDFSIGDGPEVVADTIKTGGADWAGDIVVEEVGDFVLGIIEEAEDGRKLGAGEAHKFKAIFDGFGVGSLVGYNLTLAEG